MTQAEMRPLSRSLACFTLLIAVACGGNTGNDTAPNESPAGGGTAGTSGTGSAGETTTTREAGTIGATCTGDDESAPAFSGYTETGRYIGYDDSECDTDGCLVVNFAGRKSCPNGQSEEEVAAGTGSCLTPEGETVTVSVEAQTSPDTVDRHVFCSCRCDTGVDAPCTCPADMECQQIMDTLLYPMSFCVYPDSLP